VKKIVLIAAGALLTASCSLLVDGEDPTVPSTEPSTTTTTRATTTTVFAGLPVDLTDCSNAADEFAILCDAYRLLEEHYVDPIDDEKLAGAAARGIQEFETDETGLAAPASLSCALPTEAFEETCEMFAEVQQTAPVPPEDLVEAAVQGMLQYGLEDPNTVYLSPEALTQMTEDQSGQVSGIGALVRGEDRSTEEGANCSLLSETCILVIIDTLEGSPAEAAGVLPGDGVVIVDGERVEGWTVDEVVAVVRGEAGTDVLLGLLRDGQIIEKSITRAAVVVPVVSAELLEPGIGYVALSAFTNNSAGQVHEALENLLDEGADNVIFDLRNNPGGSLTASVRIASEFLPDGRVLRTESPAETREYEVEPGGAATDPEIEIAVLVNRGSASASELISAVLQERDRATIIGEPTFGKNTVQQRYNVTNGGAVSLSVARWVTPEGRDTGTVGVQPDFRPEVPPDAETDVVLEFALEFVRG